MKYLFPILFLSMALWSCSSSETPSEDTEMEVVETLTDKVLADFSALEDVKEGNAVVQFIEEAKENAKDEKTLKKGNLASILEELKAGGTGFLIVEEHTIVKITDFEDCKMSGSWGECMPMGTGYVRKGGKLEKKKDYINNIIGTPGGRKVRVYFF